MVGDWPTTGGSSLEKLQLVPRRVPDTIRELSGIVQPPAPATPTERRSVPSPAGG